MFRRILPFDLSVRRNNRDFVSIVVTADERPRRTKRRHDCKTGQDKDQARQGELFHEWIWERRRSGGASFLTRNSSRPKERIARSTNIEECSRAKIKHPSLARPAVRTGLIFHFPFCITGSAAVREYPAIQTNAAPYAKCPSTSHESPQRPRRKVSPFCIFHFALLILHSPHPLT